MDCQFLSFYPHIPKEEEPENEMFLLIYNILVTSLHSIIVCTLNLLYLQLSNQRRQLLKDKFKGFNAELEELHHVQEQWSIPDAQLRARIRSDNIEMIVPLYSEFYRM